MAVLVVLAVQVAVLVAVRAVLVVVRAVPGVAVRAVPAVVAPVAVLRVTAQVGRSRQSSPHHRPYRRRRCNRSRRRSLHQRPRRQMLRGHQKRSLRFRWVPAVPGAVVLVAVRAVPAVVAPVAVLRVTAQVGRSRRSSPHHRTSHRRRCNRNRRRSLHQRPRRQMLRGHQKRSLRFHWVPSRAFAHRRTLRALARYRLSPP
ncbi:hypothetical protein Pph01_05590 [Planotetraspora phitsanulokensis]|uniref:Uncharacterized protein n=1 Tax=Planotetraspora phitsanulokensis TaxID=575192 RepID=A0A8J3XCC4_9ACTN|nr:hypothetical protein Pph01_05590 [Planotetraspora phitsanulokensis]